ncbi:MAG: hypothetical protein AAFN77_24110 [Planctomycetota bacterium]
MINGMKSIKRSDGRSSFAIIFEKRIDREKNLKIVAEIGGSYEP